MDMRIKILAIIIWSVHFVSCHHLYDDVREEGHRGDKNVYVDISNILHFDNHCSAIAEIPNRGGKPIKVYMISDIGSKDYEMFCSECLDDNLVATMITMATPNYKINDLNDNESRKWLYNTLKNEGYNVGKNYEEFDSLMDNNAESRKWCYDRAREHGYNVGKNYEEFEGLIFPTRAE